MADPFHNLIAQNGHIVLVIEDVGTEISIPIGDALLHHLIHAFAKGVILPVKLEHTEDAGIHKVGATGLSIRRPHSPSHYRIFFAIENLCGNLKRVIETVVLFIHGVNTVAVVTLCIIGLIFRSEAQRFPVAQLAASPAHRGKGVSVVAAADSLSDGHTAPAGMSKGINSRWICVVFQKDIRHNIALDEVCVIPSHPSKGGVYAVYIHTYVR